MLQDKLFDCTNMYVSEISDTVHLW